MNNEEIYNKLIVELKKFNLDINKRLSDEYKINTSRIVIKPCTRLEVDFFKRGQLIHMLKYRIYYKRKLYMVALLESDIFMYGYDESINNVTQSDLAEVCENILYRLYRKKIYKYVCKLRIKNA